MVIRTIESVNGYPAINVPCVLLPVSLRVMGRGAAAAKSDGGGSP
jgi:hypothetical protein